MEMKMRMNEKKLTNEGRKRNKKGEKKERMKEKEEKENPIPVEEKVLYPVVISPSLL